MKRKMVIILVVFVMLGTTAFANARFLSYGYPNADVDMNDFHCNALWQESMDKALYNWNAMQSHVGFYTTGESSYNDVEARNLSDTFYARSAVTHENGSVLYFDIVLNAQSIAKDATNVSNFITSVLAHELGKTVYLSDERSPVDCLMSLSRDRNTMTLPQAYDIEGVDIKY